MVEISGFRSGLPGSWQSIPKPSFARCLARDLRTSAQAYSVVFSEAYRRSGAWCKYSASIQVMVVAAMQKCR
jgi:hypothetical protein